MKIIYCGIDVFLPVFEYLADSREHEIIELHTYHAEHEYIRDYYIIEAAKRRNIPVNTDRIDANHLEELFKTGGCDLLLSAEYDRKLPVLSLENYRGINIHNSLLPEGRGYFPIEMRLYKNYDYGGVTIHKLAEQFDKGEVLLQERFAITETDCSLDVYHRGAEAALNGIKKVMGDFEGYWDRAKQQDETQGSWWPLPSDDMLMITPQMGLAEIYHTVRSFSYLTRLRINRRLYAVNHLDCSADDGKKYVPLPPNSWMIAPDLVEKHMAEQEIVFRVKGGLVKVRGVEIMEESKDEAE